MVSVGRGASSQDQALPGPVLLPRVCDRLGDAGVRRASAESLPSTSGKLRASEKVGVLSGRGARRRRGRAPEAGRLSAGGKAKGPLSEAQPLPSETRGPGGARGAGREAWPRARPLEGQFGACVYPETFFMPSEASGTDLSLQVPASRRVSVNKPGRPGCGGGRVARWAVTRRRGRRPRGGSVRAAALQRWRWRSGWPRDLGGGGEPGQRWALLGTCVHGDSPCPLVGGIQGEGGLEGGGASG